MSKNIVKYEHFCLRIHDEDRELLSDPTSWVLKARDGALSAFEVGQVSNPAPHPKTQTEDIPGVSGVLDMTEEDSRVFFDNKTVTVALQGDAGFTGMDEIERLFASYQGRVMDFTFDDYLSVRWFCVGRMTATCSRSMNRVVLTFDAEPYRRGTEKKLNILEMCPNLDRSLNKWNTGTVTGGNAIFMESVGNKICYGVDVPGTEIELYHDADSNRLYMLGVRSIIGGTIELYYDDEDGVHYHNFLAKSDTGTSQQGGRVYAKLVVDGSYYEWQQDTRTGTLTYMPVIRVEYVFTKPNQIVSGSDVRLDAQHIVKVPTNVLIRPLIEQFSNPCTLVVDGVAVDSPLVRKKHTLSKVVLPGIRADYSANEVESVIAILPPDYAIDATGGDPSTTVTTYPLEVF